MARLARIAFEGAFYHVMSRGNRRKDIFSILMIGRNFVGKAVSRFRQWLAKNHKLPSAAKPQPNPPSSPLSPSGGGQGVEWGLLKKLTKKEVFTE